jgi:hypothetical protein
MTEQMMTMSPEERDRLARLEVRTEHQQVQLDSIVRKLDQLLEAAAMGKGAWWAILKIGGIMTVIGGVIAWVWSQFRAGP